MAKKKQSNVTAASRGAPRHVCGIIYVILPAGGGCGGANGCDEMHEYVESHGRLSLLHSVPAPGCVWQLALPQSPGSTWDKRRALAFCATGCGGHSPSCGRAYGPCRTQKRAPSCCFVLLLWWPAAQRALLPGGKKACCDSVASVTGRSPWTRTRTVRARAGRVMACGRFLRGGLKFNSISSCTQATRLGRGQVLDLITLYRM